VIFISTHSKEERGDLFAGEEGHQKRPRPVAVKVDLVSLQMSLTNVANTPAQFSLYSSQAGWTDKNYNRAVIAQTTRD
ncbi:hypothetical protein PAXRUDRAFT_178019, partial [Paxillus rubicundulus Ve08.2h10]